ncbi:hypothetical protein V8C42DRAFT_109111 [Trichoderma barbatum]
MYTSIWSMFIFIWSMYTSLWSMYTSIWSMYTSIWSMYTSIWSFFGSREEQEPLQRPPPVTFVGVRIPADGTPAHRLLLTTMSDELATDSFLFHVPDLRSYWTSETAWRQRDIDRIDLLQDNHIPPSHHLRQKDDLRKLLRLSGLDHKQMLHLRQRYLVPQQYRVVQQQYHSCTGTYYVFYSFDGDNLPRNKFVPPWIGDTPDSLSHYYCGDVFLVKTSPHENRENGWAVYEDIVPHFLDLLAEGPLDIDYCPPLTL